MTAGARGGRRPFAGLVQAYRDALGPGGIAFATPQVALVIALLLAYGGGIVLVGDRLGSASGAILLAVLAAIVGALIGITIGWGRHPLGPARPVRVTPWLVPVGAALVAVGVATLVAYIARIGEIPLFMSSVEQGRVDAAERGGAALRVLSLLALPGVWLLVAAAATTRRRGLIIAAVLMIVLVAALQASTANRSHAFQTVIVSILIAFLVSGRQRLRTRGLALLLGAAVLAVIAAGAFGAYRLGSIQFQGPPAPGKTVVEGPERDYAALTAIAVRGYAVVPARNFAYTLEAVPELIGWRLGLTYLQPVLTVLPGRQVTFDQDLKAALGQTYAGGGTVPSLLGESYANFGPPGWFFVPLLLGMLTTWFYRRAHERQSPALWTLYAYLIFHVSGAMLSGLFVASIFPYEAYAVLGLAAILEWRGWRTRTVASTESDATRPGTQSASTS